MKRAPFAGGHVALIATDSWMKQGTAVLPTSIGIGHHSLLALIALPLLERAQVRSVAGTAAREMASRVSGVVRGE